MKGWSKFFGGMFLVLLFSFLVGTEANAEPVHLVQHSGDQNSRRPVWNIRDGKLYAFKKFVNPGLGKLILS